jgi:hypothetical protein
MYIVADRGATFVDDACAAMMTIFQYCLLVSFLWINIQVYNLHQMASIVFISYERNFMLKRCLLGWGEFS